MQHFGSIRDLLIRAVGATVTCTCWNPLVHCLTSLFLDVLCLSSLPGGCLFFTKRCRRWKMNPPAPGSDHSRYLQPAGLFHQHPFDANTSRAGEQASEETREVWARRKRFDFKHKQKIFGAGKVGSGSCSLRCCLVSSL